MRAALRSTRQARFEHVVFFSRRRKRRRGGALPLNPPPRIAAHDDLPPHPHGQDEHEFLHWLFAQAGLDAHAYRPETLHRRIGACLRELRVGSLAEARRALERDRTQLAQALNALVIGVTSFFRDANVFNHIMRSVLPALPKPPQTRRIWSVGCSEGEELYSLAILLAEQGLLEGAELLGTDCRSGAIAHARRGAYEASALRSIPPQWWDKHFEKEGIELRVAPRLRRRVRWRVADVTRLREPGAWDIILCRNMAIYLRAHVAGALWSHLEDALRPGGFLVLGRAERPIGAKRLSAIAPCIYRRDQG